MKIIRRDRRARIRTETENYTLVGQDLKKRPRDFIYASKLTHLAVSNKKGLSSFARRTVQGHNATHIFYLERTLDVFRTERQ
jgi:hypothetical protein